MRCSNLQFLRETSLTILGKVWESDHQKTTGMSTITRKKLRMLANAGKFSQPAMKQQFLLPPKHLGFHTKSFKIPSAIESHPSCQGAHSLSRRELPRECSAPRTWTHGPTPVIICRLLEITGVSNPCKSTHGQSPRLFHYYVWPT